MKNTSESNDGNPIEIDAAIEEEARAAAAAVRARRHVDVLLGARSSTPTPAEKPVEHMTRAEYARSRRVSTATVSRLEREGLPTIPVGSTTRIDPTAADDWRRARGRRPTTPTKQSTTDVDVDAALARAGLRIGGVR